MNPKQRETLQKLCASYKVAFRESDYNLAFDLPKGWVAGWVGGIDHSGQGPLKRTLYVGVSPEGEASS